MRLGRTVQVLERRTPEQLQDQGGGLRLGKDVTEFLESLGPSTGDELTYLVRHRRLVVFGKDGEEIESQDINVPSTSWGYLHRTLRKEFDRLAASTHSTFIETASVKNVYEISRGSVAIEYEHNRFEETVPADLVVGADGASSRLRQIFAPEIERKYSGYVVWQGLVPYSDLKGSISDSLIYNRNWHFGNDYMAVGYSVPKQDDSQDDQVNWAWFLNAPQENLSETMTDSNGKQHSFTISAGSVSPKVVQKMHEIAHRELPRGLSTSIQKAKRPFVQAIADALTPQVTFLDGKVVLVGDAVEVIRYIVPTDLHQYY